jgi:hypothetical protein
MRTPLKVMPPRHGHPLPTNSASTFKTSTIVLATRS